MVENLVDNVNGISSYRPVGQYNSIISRVFPGQELETLVALPREDLVNLAVTLPAPTTSPVTSEPVPIISWEHNAQKSEGADSLETLEQAPDQGEIDEAKRHRDRVNAISDDVNGLSLSDKQSSYVGISSISAALKVIFKTTPMARAAVAQSYTETAVRSRSNTPPSYTCDPDPNWLPPPDVGHRLIDSYFNHVHVLMPMIDEDQFWHTYLYGERKDPSWLALLNMVMAFGSLSKSTCDSEEHIAYFQRARKHLDLETFGSGNLLVLQALGILAGYYLHWLNRPNEANCLMGATLRMATALGLHREYTDGHPPGSSGGWPRQTGHEVPVEIKRRTWWSLFCLDAWGSTTTGRPSLGRMGPGITVQSPKTPEQMNNAQYLASLKLLPIIHNIEFCKIATRVQDTLAARSLCTFEELFALDAELVKWHNELPPILRDLVDGSAPKHRKSFTHGYGAKLSLTPSAATASKQNPFDFSQPPDRDHTACPEVLKTPRAIMHWRYQNLRMLMHRPFLLAAALRRKPYASMSAEEKVAIGRCRIIAGQTITDINLTCEDELIAGWNAVWLMYQAVMVPLVSLFSRLSSSAAYSNEATLGGDLQTSPGGTYRTVGGAADADKWRSQIGTALQFFEKMQRYSVAAKKSKDVVERLYEASKQVEEHYAQLHKQHEEALEQQQQTLAHEQPLPASDEFYGFASFSSNFQFANHPSEESAAIGQSIGDLSPNGETAMNTFWDHMMWETFPEIPDNPGWIPGLNQYDWIPPNDQQHALNLGGQDWSQWAAGEEQ
ncbi:hypothetical protein LTR37_000368 [Vermiconidia calcicola]|uniref:Uncharacterized protein n=1 Tax=Vermiconidia calcicola TaxID=1690605 RepID=A0ACC3NYP4_9PEZI|nr:hypothetical protein LTR37_000368 [Vermiconidia calcicola]